MFENTISKLSDNALLFEKVLSSYYENTDDANSLLIEAQKYGLLGAGKRIRAFLVMEISRIFNGDHNAALAFASAIELIHASSLVHDDLPCMDNDDFRRGKPSTHKAYGESIALLAGDAMMIKAFEIIASNSSLNHEMIANAVKILAAGTGEQGMLSGQAMDTDIEHINLNLDQLIKLHHFKTGKLILASAKLGCLSCRINEDDPKYCAIMKYATNIGLAFQIVDDIIDYNSGSQEAHSFLAFMSLENAQDYAVDLTKDAIEAIKPYDDGTLTELANYLTIREN